MSDSTEVVISTPKVPSIRTRGRPKGTGRRATEKWQPKSWKPLYDEVVALHCINKSNIEIATLKNIGVQQVSNILTCDKGIEIKAQLIGGIRKKLGETLDTRVGNIIDKTISRTHDLLQNDEYFAKQPVMAIKMGLAVGRATGHLDSDAFKPGRDSNNDSNTIVNNTLNVIGESGISLLMQSLRNSDEAKRLNKING